MESVYRCANCGHIIKRPDAACPACRYQRNPEQNGDPVYLVHLVSFGPNVSQTASILMRVTRRSLRESLDLQHSLPVLLLSSVDTTKISQLVNLLEQAGAEVRVTTKSVLDESDEGSMEDHAASPTQTITVSPDKKHLKWLIPIIAMIPIIINAVPEIMRKFPVFAEHILSEYIQRELGGFDEVMVVAAARDLDEGTILTMADLKPVVISRREVAQNAIAPLHVDTVVGRMITRSISKNQIILMDTLKGVTNHE